ncbi:hypothetical protein R1sor_019006 [Riccia sorocarpa]|uniref:Uncharacterized protein n=1 Tax=Riccia sorocarpa TaxID=122646 RepID=A0ABD3IHI7_9MARC
MEMFCPDPSFTHPSIPIPDERVLTQPRNDTDPISQENESSEKSCTSSRSKACSLPGVEGKPTKRRKSASGDEMGKTMKDFVQAYRENADERKKQEREKIELMKQMLELWRMELEAQQPGSGRRCAAFSLSSTGFVFAVKSNSRGNTKVACKPWKVSTIDIYKESSKLM